MISSIITWYIIGTLIAAVGIFSYEYFYLYDKEIEYISSKEIIEDILLSFLSWLMVLWLVISVGLDIYMGWPSKGFDLNLKKKKHVIYCGDLNVAHEEIDIKNPKDNRHNAGFTDEEREKMTLLLKEGYVDTFRYFHPEEKDAYSWWSYRFHARERNTGWRIDYFIVSERLKERLTSARIHPEIIGSDHCPVELQIL